MKNIEELDVLCDSPSPSGSVARVPQGQNTCKKSAMKSHWVQLELVQNLRAGKVWSALCNAISEAQRMKEGLGCTRSRCASESLKVKNVEDFWTQRLVECTWGVLDVIWARQWMPADWAQRLVKPRVECKCGTIQCQSTWVPRIFQPLTTEISAGTRAGKHECPGFPTLLKAERKVNAWGHICGPWIPDFKNAFSNEACSTRSFCVLDCSGACSSTSATFACFALASGIRKGNGEWQEEIIGQDRQAKNCKESSAVTCVTSDKSKCTVERCRSWSRGGTQFDCHAWNKA